MSQSVLSVKPRKKKKLKRSSIVLLLMMLPGTIYLFINNYIPMAGLVIAFKKYDYTKGIFGSPWNGLRNFTYLFQTNDAVNIVRNTILYNVVFIVLGTVFAVAVAVMLNFLQGTMNKKIYQTLILIPYLISMVVVSYIVFAFLSSEAGVINSARSSMGLNKISWYTNPKYWPVILTIVHLWKGFGYSSIVYYATVIGIDSSLYDAAAIDGANRWKQVWHVTLPGLKHVIITMTLLSIGRIFSSDFGLFYQVPMRSRLLASTTDTIDVFVYTTLTQLNDVGRSAAAGFLQSILGFILVLITNRVVSKLDKDSALF